MTNEITRRSLGVYAAGAAVIASVGIGQVAEAGQMSGDWLAMIKSQHQEIDRRLMATKNANGLNARKAAFKSFMVYLSAHSLAEEVSVYPAIAIMGSESDAKQLYHEQDDAEILVARIDNALAMGAEANVQAMLDQLATALHAHVAEEEGQKFPALKSMADAKMNAKLTHDFHATFSRAVA